jgi:hypothetical protein
VAGEVNGEVGNGEQRVGHGGNYGWQFLFDNQVVYYEMRYFEFLIPKLFRKAKRLPKKPEI